MVQTPGNRPNNFGITDISTHFFFLQEITDLSGKICTEKSVQKNATDIKKTIIWPNFEYSVGV